MADDTTTTDSSSDWAQTDAKHWLDFVSETARAGCWRWDSARNRMSCSPLCLELLRLPAAPDFAGFLATFEIEDRARVDDAVRTLLEAGRDGCLQVEARLAPAPGRKTAWVRVHGRAAPNNAPGVIDGLVFDITERKHGEQALLDSNDRLQRAQQAARLGTWEWDLRTGHVVWSDGIYDLFGEPRRSFDPSFERWLGYVVPEDKEATVREARAAMERGGGFNLEFRVRRADGQVRWLLSVGRAEKDETGRPVRMLGSNVDITESRETLENLRRGEREFRAMFQLAAAGTAQGDPATGRFLRVNATLCAITGYSEEELLGMTFWQVTHPDDRDRDRPALEGMLRGENDQWRSEKRYVRKDGSLRWVLVSACIVRDEAGRPWRAAAVIVDITEQKRVEAALREAQAREHSYLEHLPVGIWFLNTAGGIAYGNPAARQIWAGARYVGPERFGEYKAWWHGTDRRVKAEEWAAARAIRDGETSLDELLDIECFDGTRKIMLNSAVPVRDASGAVVGAVVFNQDVTALKQAERLLRENATQLEHTVAERTAELREANEQLETFVYSVAHDLRGPLRALTGFAQLLVEDYAAQLDQTGRHMLGRIQGSSEFMDRLVLDLLAFGRTARAQLDLGPVSVAKAWATACYQCADQLEETRAAIEAEETLPWVRGHEATLGQMLANLLGNALKFAKPGERPEVRFHAEARGERVRLWVEDKGIGVPADQHERVFRVFERLHGGRFAGTGVGLAIVRKGAERMGGAAGVESALGEGSRFWIELPRA